MPFDALFAPLTLRQLTLANRVVMTPTSNVLARNRLPTEAQAAFYAARAGSGVGLIVSEGLRVHPTNCGAGSIGTFNPAVVAGLARIAERVHEHGVPIIGQIMHGGRQSHQHFPHLLWASADVACAYSGYVPHAMTLAEVTQMRDHFVAGALRVQDAGWDGVELHAAQGHLVHQFLSPLANARTDRYGGDAERRLTFVLEVLAALRTRCGERFVIGVRLASSEFVDGGLDIAASAVIAGQLEARASIDYVSISQGNFMSIAAHIPDRRTPPHPYIDQAKRVRQALSRVPLVAAARIRTPDEAQALLVDGSADLIGLTRPLIADPHWPNKARGGTPERIRRSIYCNVCWHSITHANAIQCVHNPLAGREAELTPIVPAPQAKHVAVVGGGPVGLAAAEAAARRGHRITLFERDQALGGQLHWAAVVPGDAELAEVTRYLAGEVRALGVDIRLGTAATVEGLAGQSFDAIVVATGSMLRRDALTQVVDVPTLAGVDVIEQRAKGTLPSWRRVAVIDRDGYFATYAVTEMLAEAGIDVTFVTFQMSIGHDLPAANLTGVLGRLDALGVAFYCAHELARADREALRLRHAYARREKRLPAVDAIVVAGGHRAADALFHALERVNVAATIALVGDAVAPRAIKDAIYEGHRIGRQL
jgi:2,4-dienoyl-CoA reductase-like NADH-dependent reductase (Old Yellow Enzyme family)